MEFKENTIIAKNYTVTRVRESKQLGGRLVELKHNKTKTEIVWVDNKDDNKLFSISFKTLPSDSTGVFHILEHSVLCGSEKYPVKEPFVDLLKSSMNTFLNALTFQDKTMYPVSSRNAKDFLNLTSVYLDAVFAPAILKNKNIFYQEGWHIEQDEDGTLSYKGVVFNEMKGAMSSKDTQIGEKILTLLFPDNCYGVNSGGDPENIPDLTYEKFIETYKKFYHPSNARVYLDGDVPMEETLALLDSYLSKYEKSKDLPELIMQKPVSCEETMQYTLAEDEDSTDKGQLTLAKIFADYTQVSKSLQAAVLFNALCDSNDSVYKKAILESGLAQDLEILVNDDAGQIFLSIDAKNVKDGCDQQIIDILKDETRQLVKNGIDRKSLIAAINSMEYKAKAPEEPAGLIRCMKSMLTWLYGGDPITYLELDDEFKKLRDLLDTDSYEKLLEELILDDNGMCILHSVPSATLSAEKDAKEAERLAKIKESWTDAQIKENKYLNEKLLSWQQTADTKEQTDTLPVLPLSEVSENPDWTETEVLSQCGVKVLYHPIHTNGIVHMNLYFRMTDYSLEELTAIASLGQILSFIPTKNKTTLELEEEIKTYLGDLSFKLGVYSKKDDTELATPVLVASCSVLKENLKKAEDLIIEILTETVFDKEQILDILRQCDIRARQVAVSSGHALAKTCVMALTGSDEAVNEVITGRSAIVWSHEIVDKFDEKSDEYIALMNRALKSCNRSNLVASITADSKEDISYMIEKLEEGSAAPVSAHYITKLPKNIGIKIPAQIGYAVQGCCYKDIDKSYDGSLAVAANILTLDYLWNVVRVQGGAYGTGLKAAISGALVTYSYRDPSPKLSIEANKGCGEHLRKFCTEVEELDKYIISTIAATEPLVSPQAKGILADRDYFCGYTFEDVKQQRKQILKTDYAALNNAADIVDVFAEKAPLCIVAPSDKLAEFEGLTILDI